jgi:hypothetical protein
MYARIERYDQVTAAGAELIPAGRQCTAALGQLPGFIAYVLLQAGPRQLLAVSVFEEEADLLAAAQLPALGPQAAGQPCVISGEVLVQKGL